MRSQVVRPVQARSSFIATATPASSRNCGLPFRETVASCLPPGPRRRWRKRSGEDTLRFLGINRGHSCHRKSSKSLVGMINWLWFAIRAQNGVTAGRLLIAVDKGPESCARSSGRNFKATKPPSSVSSALYHTHPVTAQLLDDAIVRNGLPHHGHEELRLQRYERAEGEVNRVFECIDPNTGTINRACT